MALFYFCFKPLIYGKLRVKLVNVNLNNLNIKIFKFFSIKLLGRTCISSEKSF